MFRGIILILILLGLAFIPLGGEEAAVRIGSKKNTESVLLGELLVQLSQAEGIPSVHYAELGGTRILFEALKKGEIDAYVEYTGTIGQEILADPKLDPAGMRAQLADQQIHMSQPLGFNNTYALAVLRETADRLDLKNISDLARHPEMKFGFSNEFLDREDGWKNLRKHYGLSQQNVAGLDHDLAYRQLELGEIDLMDIYTTDAKMRRLDVVLLEDDRNYFPRYDAVLLTSPILQEDYSQVYESFTALVGQISDEDMRRLNAEVEIGRNSETSTAAKFLEEKFGLEIAVKEDSVWDRLVKHTIEHLDLVRKSLIPAIFVAIPLGILAAKRRKLGQAILGAVGIVQTIPALALLVLLMPLMSKLEIATIGVGSGTAIAALFLYSLLPIVRNTATGFTGIPPVYLESAQALGLSPTYRLLHIELPLASPSILAGIKTAAVLNVGFATLGALIGAGGYGQPILTGIRLNDTGLIMQGALPAAALAVIFQVGFELAEPLFVPKGLRLSRNE